VSIDTSEVEAFYQAHLEEFRQPDAAKVRHIFFRLDPAAPPSDVAEVQRRATQVLQEARDGHDFESLARRYSEDATAAKGGDLGVIRRGETVPAFEQVVFSLREGAISEVFRTPNGLHIVKVESSVLGETNAFADAREAVERRLLQEKTDARFREWTDELRNKAFVEVTLHESDGER
jgi:peptidyl-prolyl cis-trans isomerase SurA